MDGDEANDELPPLPQLTSPTTLAGSPKRLRRRAPFGEPSINLTTNLITKPQLAHPPPPSSPLASARPDQIISTLINSLSAISQSTRDQLHADFVDAPEYASALHSERPVTPDSFYADIPIRRTASTDLLSDNEADSDSDVAARPVIHMGRGPPSKKKEPRIPSSSSYLDTIYTQNSLSVRPSFHSMRSHDGEMGIPSIERPDTSSTSLAASMWSSRSISPSKTRESPPNLSPMRPISSESYSDLGPSDSHPPTTHFIHEQENNDPRCSFDTGSEPVKRDPVTSNGDSHPISSLSPLNKDDLQDHLIPNRRSSLRRSSTTEERDSHRNSTGSRDLRDLNIDEDLIGSDDSTVRRIRELHEAREKRQIEWRKESRKGFERSSKRHSAPSPKAIQRSTTYQSSKLSVTEVLIESEQETAPDLSATISGNDLGLLPALVTNDEPLTPSASPPEFARQFAPSPRPTPKKSPVRESRPSSIRVKRSSTVSSNTADSGSEHVKSISDEVDAFLSAPRLTQKIRHPRTGRTIAFSQVGDPDGFVVFCCVGMGLTRFVTTFYDELARTLKLRLITPDRPGVGESEAVPERLNNPLTWVDDVAVICHSLEIARFSLLAHSAGAIYALATALKMPQYVRGRIHLLAPWIPPSQMPKGAAIGPDSQPIANLPMAHRILSVLPTSMLKVANSRFLSATSASIDPKPQKGKKGKHLDPLEADFSHSFTDLNDPSLEGVLNSPPKSSLDSSGRGKNVSCYQANNDYLSSQSIINKSQSPEPRSVALRSSATSPRPASPRMILEARATLYNQALTHKIWNLAILNANPAIDLMICLERKKPIGFRYAEVTRSVVIHHGAKDSRVPLDNVRWLHSIMKRCELRVLETEGHSLMANASVMSSVLTEIAKEWDEWEKIAKHKEKKKRDDTSSARSFRSASVSVRS